MGPSTRTWARQRARGPTDPRLGPLIRTLRRLCARGQRRPRAYREVDVRIKGVNAHIQRFACELHARPGAVVPRSQTTSPATPHCWRLSPRWSALWAPRHLEPRPHRQQTGGNCSNRGATRGRHTGRMLLMVQNPRRHAPTPAPCSPSGAALLGQALLGVGDGVDGWCCDEPWRASQA